MASFYIHDRAQALTIQICGVLTTGAAAEVEQTWLTARSTLAGRELLIDLSDVISVNDGGQPVLRLFAGHGARFITASDLTDSLAHEISQRMPKLFSSPRQGVRNRFGVLFENVLWRCEDLVEAWASVHTNWAKALVVETVDAPAVAHPLASEGWVLLRSLTLLSDVRIWCPWKAMERCV